jgi:SAM-dependent methyltransferase
MNYLVKAYLQKFFAMVPRSIGDIIYYKIQRKFGSLRCVRTSQYVDNAIRINNACGESGFKIDGRKLFELGTGRTVSTPIAMILLGADSVTTVDVNRYLRTGLAFESAGEVFKKFKELGCNKCINKYESGFNKIAAQNVLNKASIQDLLDLFNIKYNAPFNGDKTVIESGLFDLYFSTNVIEHVPKGEIEVLFKEAKRILKPNGIMAHYIDLRDHFAATDKTITNVNFLKYSTEDWHKLAGNRQLSK